MEQLSDESDFYGDEETVSALEARVESFNVDQYWRDRGAHGLAVPQRQSASRSPSPQFHNPYAGHPGAWQLSETVDAFLARLPPATTERRDGLDWIFICNPFIERKSKAESDTRHIQGCEDEGPEDKNAQVLTFKSGGEERLEMLGAYMDFARQGGVSTVAATREANKARADAVKDILELAAFTHVTTGKWMLFPEPSAVNDVWEVVARATARNELGIAAKVAPRDPEADPRRDRLVCIYTTDFRDKDDVARVLLSMRKLGLVTSTGRPIYYKPDAYTYLGIGSGNKWDLRASFYDSKEIFSHLSKGR